MKSAYIRWHLSSLTSHLTFPVYSSLLDALPGREWDLLIDKRLLTMTMSPTHAIHPQPRNRKSQDEHDNPCRSDNKCIMVG